MPHSITTLFVDVGGVLLTNSWGHIARERAARHFALDFSGFDHRHHQMFHLYEEGRLSLSEYLEGTVFHEERPFTRTEFREFMLAQSKPWPEMIELVHRLKTAHDMRIVAISNEGWELARHRIEQFALKAFIDDFVFSCFVGRRKPDPDIYQIALNITQVLPESVVYVEENPMFVAAARNIGIETICHTANNLSQKALATMGLS
jgi:putative hydrolase of the HAD superfamily